MAEQRNGFGALVALNLRAARDIWGVVVLACAAAAVLCWLVVAHVYEGRLEAGRAEFAARLGAAQAELRDVRGQLALAKAPAAPAPGEERDQDTLYQAGNAAARAGGGEIDLAARSVHFARVTGGPDFSLQAPMEFRQFALSGCQYGSYGTRSSFGVVRQQDYEDVRCRIAPRGK